MFCQNTNTVTVVPIANTPSQLKTALYQPALRLTQEGDSQSGKSLNLWHPVGGYGHGCSDRLA